MAFACKICAEKNGLTMAEIADLVTAKDDEEEFSDHLEKVHDMIVRRPGETREDAIARWMSRQKILKGESNG